jgi:amidohydrolase
LHQHPEGSYKEFETTAYIKGRLDELGIAYDSPLETGCVARIEGKNPNDRIIALRADIDALPMEESGEHKADFLSRNPGAAHCCGHDAHTANLLGAAKILKELQHKIKGTVYLIFQPGEEKLPGGGRLLCETGYLQSKNIQQIFGLHTSPDYAPGTIAIREGELMARPDEFEIEIIGKGGHAAKPHQAVDPIVMASQFVNAVQTLVSRYVDPTEKAVVTVGKIQGGTAHNIIPEKVELLGTVRTFNSETAELIKHRMEALLKGITEGAGGSYTFNFNYGYPPVINTKEETQLVISHCKALFGEDSVIEMDKPIMAGEDFAFYQEHFPGAFFFLGSGSDEAGSRHVWHHPKYNVDEACFKTGLALMAALAMGS